MTTELDPWALSSGSPLDGATVTVARALFTKNNEIAADAVFLELELVTEEGEKYDKYYSVGNFEIADPNGSSIKPVGSKPNINMSSNYGYLIQAALDCGAEAQAHLRAGNPLEAAVWQGTKWEYGFKTIKRRQNDGTYKESRLDIPVKYLGVGEGAVVAAKGPAISDELKAELVKLAQLHDNHKDFITDAFNVEGVSTDRKLQKMVMQEAFFMELKGA